MASADATAAATNNDAATAAATSSINSILIRQNDTTSTDCSKCTGHTILYAYPSSMNAPICGSYYMYKQSTNTSTTIVLYKRRTAKPGCTSDTRWFITGTQRYSFNNQPRRCESVTQYNVSYEFLFNLMEKIPSVDGLGTPLDETTLGDSKSSYQESYNQKWELVDNASKCDCYAICVSCLCNHDGHECECECECVCDGDCDGKCACECECHGDCDDDCADDCYLNY
jgi:hypothetical protein